MSLSNQDYLLMGCVRLVGTSQLLTPWNLMDTATVISSSL